MVNVQELKVWQASRELTKKIYLASKNFPTFEQFGLTAQIRRAAVSVVSNISEGHDRGTSKEFIHFLRISRGSVAEIQAQLIVALDIGYLSEEDYKELNELSIEIHKMLNGLIKSISKKLTS